MDEDFKELEKLIHSNPDNIDTDCPHCEWMGEDLIHCPGVGEWKCKIQEDWHGEYLQNLDYKPCNSEDHTSCPIYLENSLEV